MVNLLILSVGRRNNAVRYFKNELKGKGVVVAADMSAVAPALYEADHFELIPPIMQSGYIDAVFDICKKYNISAVLSLIDTELSVLAKYEKEFEKSGVTVVGSSYELCERSLDKMKMYAWLSEKGYKTALSYADKESFYAALRDSKIKFPVFVKRIRGSASVGAYKIESKAALDVMFDNYDDFMVQQFLDGQEIGADVYVDMISGEVVSVFTKKKIAMRAGETDKAVSFKCRRLFDFIERFTLESGYRGPIDIDLFDVDGEYYISEVNPRFGGGYIHAHECGENYARLVVNNLEGKANPKRIGCYDEGVYMMKFSSVIIKKTDGAVDENSDFGK